MFYNQPLANRFGHELNAALDSGVWTRLDIAVAWIRASGLRHLRPSLDAFLGRGGALSTIVGVDLDNTTSDGLRDLLAIGAGNNAEAFVHHNESGTVFHPKLYLLRNATDARLIIGSNNVTEAGLFRNTEVSLHLDLRLNDPIIASVLDALDSRRDLATGLALRLDEPLVQSLEANGYIKSEAVIRREQAARSAASKRAAGQLQKLFKSISVSAPAAQIPGAAGPAVGGAGVPAKKAAKKAAKKVARTANPAAAAPAVGAPSGTVLLMRVRKAHAVDRPTQTQIPMAVINSSFFNGVNSVQSAHSGELHRVSAAMARGAINTLKLEIPEMRTMLDPVVRFEKTSVGIQYEIYDASSSQGKVVMTTLAHGRVAGVANPTRLTRPNTPATSTWRRFI